MSRVHPSTSIRAQSFFMLPNAGCIDAGARRSTDGEPDWSGCSPRYSTNSSSRRIASSSTNPVINIIMALCQNSWAGPRHELWLSAIRKNAARLRGTGSPSRCYAPRSILQVQPAWPFPFSPTFQNGLRSPGFAPENLSNREEFYS